MLFCCAHGWCGVRDGCSLRRKALKSAGMQANAAHTRSLTCTAAAAAAEPELLLVLLPADTENGLCSFTPRVLGKAYYFT
jgi:hypothetical protein